jgi:hypothetical protein
MPDYGTVVFTGASGTNYTFTIYSFNTTFKDVGGVYFITRSETKQDNTTRLVHIYIGQTEHLSERFDNHHKATCFKKNKADRICIFREDNEEQRLAIEQDLIDKYNPPCNG